MRHLLFRPLAPLHRGAYDPSTGGAVNYPQVVSTATDADTDISATTQTISLPPTYSAGDLLVLFLSTQINATGTIATPTGWAATFQTAAGGGTQMLAMFYKVATGSEGSTVSVNISAASRLIGNAYAIQSGTYTGTPSYASAADSGASTSADPPSLTPGAGNTKYLWIAAVANGPNSAPTGLPTGFGNQIDAVLSGTNRPTLSSAREELTASSLDPTAFTIVTNRWITATIAIQGI